MKYYKGEGGRFAQIIEIEVEKETKEFVFILNGGREKKITEYCVYDKSKERVREILLNREITDLEKYKRWIKQTEENIEKIKKL